MPKKEKRSSVIYRKLRKVYKEGTEFIKQLIIFIKLIKETENGTKEECIKKLEKEYLNTLSEFKDLYGVSKGLYGIIEEVTWTGSGYSALYAIVKYRVLSLVPRVVKGLVAKIVSKKIVLVLRDMIPKPEDKNKNKKS